MRELPQACCGAGDLTRMVVEASHFNVKNADRDSLREGSGNKERAATSKERVTFSPIIQPDSSGFPLGLHRPAL